MPISGYAAVTASVVGMARSSSLEIVSELVANVLSIEVAEGDQVEFLFYMGGGR